MRAFTALGRFLLRELKIAVVSIAVIAMLGGGGYLLADYQANQASPGNITFKGDLITGTTQAPLIGIIGGTGETNRAGVTAGGALKTDASATTQPISGNVGITGAVDTEMTAAAALADNTANPTVPFVGGFAMVFDGATWDRWTGQILPPSPSATTNYFVVRCTDGTVFESCGGTGGSGGTSSNFASAFPTPGTAIGFSDGTNMRPGRAVDADTGAGSVFVQQNLLVKSASGGPVEIGTSTDPIRNDPTGTTTQPTGGLAAEDAPVSGNPHQIAGRASIDEPTAVSADGDVVRPWMSRFGQQVVLIGHGNPETPISIETTAVGNTTVIIAPGGTNKLCIQKGSIHNGHTANLTARLEDGVAGTVGFAAELPAEGGGTMFDFGSRGWCLTDNTLLNLNLNVDPGVCPDCVRVNVTEYYIADLP